MARDKKRTDLQRPSCQPVIHMSDSIHMTVWQDGRLSLSLAVDRDLSAQDSRRAMWVRKCLNTSRLNRKEGCKAGGGKGLWLNRFG